jgi:hypothetical protein
MADNLISSVGLNSVLQALAITNKRLKYINFSGNFVSIDILHALRCMIEKNSTLSYIVVSDIYKWQQDAQFALAESFKFNKALKEVDLKVCSQDCFDLFTSAASHIRFVTESIVKRSRRQNAPEIKAEPK